MAEGGVAAALAQRRRPRQLAGPLRRHDARRPVPQQLAHGGAAREGSAGPRARARGVGRRVRSHDGRPDPAAQLRRPHVSAPGARRRPHRARDDPHAAGPRDPPGHRRAHGVHGRSALLKDGDRVAGAFAYDRERGRFRVFRAKAVVLATGGIGRAFSITSNSWEYTGDGHALAYEAGAELMDMEFVQFHPDRDGLAAERARHPGHRGRARRGRRAAQQRGPRFMFDDIPENYKRADRRQRRGGLALHAGRQERAPPARAADARSRRALHRARGARRAREPARRRVPRHRVDQAAAARTRAEHIKKKLPSMYHQFKELADIDITTDADGGRADDALHDGRRPRGRRDADVAPCPGLFAAGECAAGLHGANRLGGNSLSDLLVFGKRAGEYAAEFARSAGDGDDRSRRRSTTAARARSRRSSAARAPGRRGPVPGPARAAGHDAGPGRHRAHRGGDAARARGDRESCREQARQVGVAGNREYNPGLAHRARSARTCSRCRRRSRARRSSGRRAAAATSATTIPRRTRQCGEVQHRHPQGRRTARMRTRARADPGDAGRARAGHRGADQS